eukprot:7933471-Alexandrium_andersonii.AAC.1
MQRQLSAVQARAKVAEDVRKEDGHQVLLSRSCRAPLDLVPNPGQRRGCWIFVHLKLRCPVHVVYTQ